MEVQGIRYVGYTGGESSLVEPTKLMLRTSVERENEHLALGRKPISPNPPPAYSS